MLVFGVLTIPSENDTNSPLASLPPKKTAATCMEDLPYIYHKLMQSVPGSSKGWGPFLHHPLGFKQHPLQDPWTNR